MQLWVDSQIKVEKVEDLAGDLPKEYVELANQTFLQTRFVPGMKHGLPVAACIRLEIRHFELVGQ